MSLTKYIETVFKKCVYEYIKESTDDKFRSLIQYDTKLFIKNLKYNRNLYNKLELYLKNDSNIFYNYHSNKLRKSCSGDPYIIRLLKSNATLMNNMLNDLKEGIDYFILNAEVFNTIFTINIYDNIISNTLKIVKEEHQEIKDIYIHRNCKINIDITYDIFELEKFNEVGLLANIVSHLSFYNLRNLVVTNKYFYKLYNDNNTFWCHIFFNKFKFDVDYNHEKLCNTLFCDKINYKSLYEYVFFRGIGDVLNSLIYSNPDDRNIIMFLLMFCELKNTIDMIGANLLLFFETNRLRSINKKYNLYKLHDFNKYVDVLLSHNNILNNIVDKFLFLIDINKINIDDEFLCNILYKSKCVSLNEYIIDRLSENLNINIIKSLFTHFISINHISSKYLYNKYKNKMTSNEIISLGDSILDIILKNNIGN